MGKSGSNVQLLIIVTVMAMVAALQFSLVYLAMMR